MHSKYQLLPNLFTVFTRQLIVPTKDDCQKVLFASQTYVISSTRTVAIEIKTLFTECK